MYEIYTDGACSDNPGSGGWAAIIKCENEEPSLLHGGAAYTTNNRMEMAAVIYALLSVPEGAEGILYSDSQYAVNGISWAKAWRKNGWKKADGKTPQNIDLWQTLLSLVESRNIKFQWIKGHADNQYNQKCDEAAVKESKMFSSVRIYGDGYDCEKQFKKGIYDVSKAIAVSFEEKAAQIAEKAASANKENKKESYLEKTKANTESGAKFGKGKRMTPHSFVREILLRIEENNSDFMADVPNGVISCTWGNAGRLQDILLILGFKYEKDFVVEASQDGIKIKITI